MAPPGVPYGRWCAAVLLTYAAGFSLFSSPVFTASDESFYVEQAVAFANGSLGWRGAGGADEAGPMGDYPPGTALLQAPFVFAGGWRAAAWASAVSLAATVWLLTRWLRDAGLNPAFAMLFLAYAPTLVLGRLAMSDVPSAAVVTLGLWLCWTAHGRGRALLAGAAAGLSFLFRETNALLVTPFIVGAVIRRDPYRHMLLAGFLLGLGVRLAVFQLVFGAPLFVRDVEGWSLGAALDAAPLYAVALLVLVPGGLLAVVTYRGPRRQELIFAVTLFLTAYLFANYSGQSSGLLPRLATAGRYPIPLVPLIAIACADVASRWLSPTRLRTLLRVAYAATLAAAFAVHPIVQQWTARDAELVRDLYAATRERGTLIVDNAPQKFLSLVYGIRREIPLQEAPPDTLPLILQAHPDVYVVDVSGTDPSGAASGSTVDGYLHAARRRCAPALVLERTYPSGRHLRVWQLRFCRA